MSNLIDRIILSVLIIFILSSFARAVLESVPTCHQLMLVKLQQVMSFLFYSFRAAYSPAVFVRTSRPPWFEAGRQQDCSEFLRYIPSELSLKKSR